MKSDTCPHCGVSLQGDLIPAEHQHFYNALDKVPGSEGWITHGRREIGIQVLGVYDGVLYWECPDCHGAWNRWTDNEFNKSLYVKAEKAIKEHYLAENHLVHHTSTSTAEVKHHTDDWDKVTCKSCLRGKSK